MKKEQLDYIFNYLENWLEYNKSDLGELGSYIRTEYMKNGLEQCRLMFNSKFNQNENKQKSAR